MRVSPFCCMQLTPYLSSGKEHGLGINVDVALWLDYRNFQNKPPLQVVQDCVIVTNELHDEFDDFNDREAIVDVSVLPFVELLQFWYASQGIPALPFLKYGKKYIKLTSSQVDNLCWWVVETRKQLKSQGKSVFEGVSTTATTPKSDVLEDVSNSDQPARLIGLKRPRKTDKGLIRSMSKRGKVSCMQR